MDSSKLTFRSSFSSFPVLWRWTTTACGAGGILISLSAMLAGDPLLTELVAVFSLIVGTVFGIAVLCFPVYVLPDGIKCYNYFGFYRTVPWTSPVSMRKKSVYGLPYLTVGSTDGLSEIYIPLYLADMPGFIEAIRDRAGEEHPLCHALMKEQAPKQNEIEVQQHGDSHA